MIAGYGLLHSFFPVPTKDYLFAWFIYRANASLRGKNMLAKISDEGAKSQLFFVLLNDLLNEAASRQKKHDLIQTGIISKPNFGSYLKESIP